MKKSMAVLLCYLGYLLLLHKTLGCPSIATAYQEAIANLSCAENLYGHCLKDEKKNTILACLKRSWIQPGLCPVYNSDAKKIDVILCKETLGKCPDTTFWSNELYKYLSCFKAVTDVEQVSTPESRTTVTTTISESTAGSKEGSPVTYRTKKESTITETSLLYVALGAVAVIFVILIVIVIVLLILCRRKRGGKEMVEQVEAATPLRSHEDEREQDGLDASLNVPLEPQDGDRTPDGQDADVPIQPLGDNEVEHHQQTQTEWKREGSKSDEVHRDVPSEEMELINSPSLEYRLSAGDIETIMNKFNTVILIVQPYDNIENIFEKFSGVKHCKNVNKFRDWKRGCHQTGESVFLQGFTSIPDAVSMTLDVYETTFEQITADIERLKLHLVIPIRVEAWNAKQEGLKSYRLFKNAHEWTI